jgi:hypothetical protein
MNEGRSMRVETKAPGPGGGDRDGLVAALREAVVGSAAARNAIVRALVSALPDEALRRFLGELEAEARTRRLQEYGSHIRRACAAAAAGSLAAAGEAAQAAVRADPLRWEAHRLLGEIAVREGQVARARERYALALHLGWDGEEARRTVEQLDGPRTRPGWWRWWRRTRAAAAASTP